MRAILTRLFDLRQGEARLVVQAFVTLFLTIAAHTTLETARDAIFLSKLPPSQLNVVYVVLAGMTLVVIGASARFALAFGRRNALIFTLVVAAYATMFLYFRAPTPRVALALYVFSGLVGAVLAPQFWLLAAQLFTVAQGRRLFGPIASGGVVGGVVGAGTAALVVRKLPVTALLPIAAALFVATALVLTTVDAEPPPEELPKAEPASKAPRMALFRDNPFLLRVAALVSLSTAAVLAVDYLFKSAAARFVPPDALGEFFARYYAVMNGISLVVQVLVAGRLVRRAGVIGAVAVMPLLLLGGGVAALALPGVFLLVLGVKAVDGGLRYSLNRVATELLHLPLPVVAREQGKGFIDSSLSRIVQAATAIVLYVLAVRSLATPRVLALIVVVLCAGWLAVAASLRRAYLDLFRRALARGGIGPDVEILELDLPSAEALVETMASPDPATVIAAMDVLHQHRRSKLVPALILYHDAEAVVIHALELFGDGGRTDWVPLAERLLADPREAVRIAAVRALAKNGNVEALRKATTDTSSRVQAYAAFHRALHEAEGDLAKHPLIATVMEAPGEYGHESRRALLAAIADAPDARAGDLLIAFASHPDLDDEEDAVAQLAHAIAVLADARFVPACVARLPRRAGRDAIRDALVAIGEPSLDALERALHDTGADRRVRLHVPRSISPFLSPRAAAILVDQLERETDGVVRYKILRALGQLVARSDVKVDRVRVEAAARKNLEEYLRLLALRAALPREAVAVGSGDPAGPLLDGLLSDKLRQSLERAFRLLKIAHKREDIHRVHTAALSADKRARGNAGEFLDALLVRRDQQELRSVLRLVVDEASDKERVERAALEGRGLARTYDEALAMLVDDKDDALAALAAHHAIGSENPAVRAAVQRARQGRPSMRAMTERLFGPGLSLGEVEGG
jgi:AAA family ATP:ADP antiporter